MRRNLLMLVLLLACGRLRHTAQRIGKGNKMFKITAKICGSEFSAEVETLAEAYERVRSILNNCGHDEFERLSTYMANLVDIMNDKLLNIENSYLRIEKVKQEELSDEK